MLPISQLSGIISQSGTQVVIAPGTPVTTLQVRATGAGTFPYSATVLPLEGQVPTGSTLQCVEDTSLRACILSTHSDGSASVVVVSGTTTVSLNQTKTLSLQTATIVGETNLNASRISSLLTDISLNFGSPYGTATISDFSSPERIWWATPTTICARYRIQPPTLSGTQLEAVIDVHAYASSTNALVEIVVENCKMNTASPSAPSAASYTSAVLTINGNTITTVNGNGAPEGYHAPFRSWYSSSWLQGDPGLRITQLYTDLQKHPLLYKMDQASTVDMAGYAGDAYSPWATGRQRAGGMGGTGDADSIGPLPKWEAHFLQTGDYRAANASEANALFVLGYNINYRDSSTGLVPTIASVAGKDQSSTNTWPTTNLTAGDQMAWEVAHHPAAGLIAFISRPSPVYIELAQKVAIWNATWSTNNDVGQATTTGVFGQYYQIRGRAWCMRSLGHATFLSPSTLAWKASGVNSIKANVTWLDGYRTSSWAMLNAIWGFQPNYVGGNYSSSGALNVPIWMYHYLIAEMHKIASAHLLTGSDQTAVNTLADWMALQPVRFINEQPNGAWRYIPYGTVIGRSNTVVDSLSDWGAMRAYWMTDAPPSVSGGWYSTGDDTTRTYSSFGANTVANAFYPAYFWAALVCAVERGVAGSATAWQTVTSNLTNLSTWRTGFASDPRWGNTPKNPPPSAGFGSDSTTGTFSSGVWTPGRDSNGLVNAVSWALVPTLQWVTVAGTALSSLESVITSALPGWRDFGAWTGLQGSWSGMAADQTNSRAWFFGGGHSNSSNNGLYRFDAFKMAWSIECMPSPVTSEWTSSGYNNYTTYPPSDAAWRTKQTAGTLGAINDIYYDEMQDGKPSSRHTYQSMVYMSDRNQIAMLCRRLWIYDLAAGAWVYKRLPNDSTSGTFPGEHMAVYYDQANQGLDFTAAASNGRDYTRYLFTGGLSSSDGNWSPGTSGTGIGYYYTFDNIARVQRGNLMVVIKRPSNNGSSDPVYTANGLLCVHNLTTRASIQYSQLSHQGGLSPTQFPGDGDTFDSQHAVYIDSLDEYWFWTKLANGTLGFFRIGTDAVITINSHTSGAFPSWSSADGCGAKAVYYPVIDTVVYTNLLTGDVSLYRLS